MKLKFSIIAFILLTVFSSCQKDWAEDWEGTYNGTAGAAINRIIVTKVDKKTLRIDLQAPVSGIYYTFATIASADLTSETAFTVDEDGTITTSPGEVYHFTGSGGRNGNTITLSGQAQNKSNSSDIKYYPFTGTR